jgi:SAM-dependent methyltransferase
MKERLLQYLVCPACQQELQLTVRQKEGIEIIEGTLMCPSCKTGYPITGGIPRFVKEVSEDKQKTAEAFGYQWTHFTEMAETYEAQFLDWIYPIQPDFFAGKVVLDAGCGIGRHTYYAAKYGAKDVIGVDISQAVETSYKQVGLVFENAHIVQADIYALPFRPGTFDFGYSIGVLHHLPDPQAGFNSVVRSIKAGGAVFGWVYGYENNGIVHYFIDPLRKSITRYLPHNLLNGMSFFLTVILQIILKGIYRPLNAIGIKSLPSNDYLMHISQFNFRTNYTIVFDHLVAPTAFYLRREEFETWFTTQHLEDIKLSWRNQNSWRGYGVIPTGQKP